MMKAETFKNALHAHGWLGIIISMPLFIVFWAGAITLFRAEIEQWAALPHHMPKHQFTQDKSLIVDLNTAVERALVNYAIAPDKRISIRYPTTEDPYLKLYFSKYVDENLKETELAVIVLDPRTGEVLFENSPFEFANFLYELHYNLKIPQGLYIVGLISLFFMILVFTGVIIQLKKLISHFFVYRKESNLANKMKDIHSVIGVMSVPFTFMYSLTGLMFNLSLLLQIPTALLLYQGDIGKLTTDAGFLTFTEQPNGVSYPMTSINTLVESIEAKSNVEIKIVNLYNFGDETAVYRIIGKYHSGFSSRYDKHYQVATDSFPEKINPAEGNRFKDGRTILFSMHFADFAGPAVKLIYFTLAVGICGMIIAGNVLWIKRREKKNHYPKTLRIIRGLTLGGGGVIPATAIGLVLERCLPLEMASRPSLVQLGFWMVWGGFVITGFLSHKHKRFISTGLLCTGVALLLVTIIDLSIFGKELIQLYQSSYSAPVAVSVFLLIVSIFTLRVGQKLRSESLQS